MKHRRDATGVVRNTIKHGVARKVAVTAAEGGSGARQAYNYRLFAMSRYMLLEFRASNWEATQEEIYL
jgi:hypothetical protein